MKSRPPVGRADVDVVVPRRDRCGACLERIRHRRIGEERVRSREGGGGGDLEMDPLSVTNITGQHSVHLRPTSNQLQSTRGQHLPGNAWSTSGKLRQNLGHVLLISARHGTALGKCRRLTSQDMFRYPQSDDARILRPCPEICGKFSSIRTQAARQPDAPRPRLRPRVNPWARP